MKYYQGDALNRLEYALAIKLFEYMEHHCGIIPVTSWQNITSRNAIESNSRRFIFQTIQWIRIRVSQTIPELYNLLVPDSVPSRLALPWLQLIMSTVASSMSVGFPGYRQQCFITGLANIYVLLTTTTTNIIESPYNTVTLCHEKHRTPMTRSG